MIRISIVAALIAVPMAVQAAPLQPTPSGEGAEKRALGPRMGGAVRDAFGKGEQNAYDSIFSTPSDAPYGQTVAPSKGFSGIAISPAETQKPGLFGPTIR